MKFSIKVFILTLTLAIAYINGSRWHYTSSRDTLLFERMDDDIKKLPILTKINKGTILEVKECYFDKSDAYLLVEENQYKGFSDDIRQPYVHSWNLKTAFQLNKFIQQFDCWRLTSQFYEEN